MAESIALQRGLLRVELMPSFAGSVTRFTLSDGVDTFELFRATHPQTLRDLDPLGLACFPLVPFSNRIKNGQFTFRGTEYRMAPNMAPHPHPLHGHGWRTAWQLVERAPDRALVRFDYAGSDWPSAYSATQRFSISENALEIAIRLTNAGSAPMPAAIGVHPYFPKPPGTRLCASLASVWLTDSECIPHGRVPTPEQWTFANGQVLDDVVLDHCFGGWDGRARIEWPSTNVAIDIEADAPFGHAVIYSPKGRDFFCFEPVSNATDAVNLVARAEPDTGLVELAPGESLEGSVRFVVSRGR